VAFLIIVFSDTSLSLSLCACLCVVRSRPLFLFIFSLVGAHNKSVSFHLKYLASQLCACFVRQCAQLDYQRERSLPLFRIDKRAAVNFSSISHNKKATFHSLQKTLVYFHQPLLMHPFEWQILKSNHLKTAKVKQIQIIFLLCVLYKYIACTCIFV
jgi:hypothetical protein